MKLFTYLLLSLLCLSFEPATAAESTLEQAVPVGSGRPFREIIGLQVKYSQGEPLSNLPTLKELGVRWVRDHVGWPTLEPKPGAFRPFPFDFQRRLKFYRDNNIGVVFLLGMDNSVAYPPDKGGRDLSIDPKLFAAYALHVAKLLKESGVEFVLEIWNEPHNSLLYHRLGGTWNGHPPSPWLNHYVEMVRETVSTVKAHDQEITLLTDDDMWIVHYWFLEAGLPNDLDGFAFHPYNGLNPPEMAAVDKQTDWLRPFDVVDEDSSFRSAVRRLREHGRIKLGHTPQLWITEWGWATGTDPTKAQISEEQLAGYVPRAFIMAEAAGVKVMCWFSSQDTVDGPMGLIDNDRKRRLSYQAFKTMSQQLGDYVLVSHLAGHTNQTAGTQAFLFKGQRDYKIVLWTLDNTTLTLPVEQDLGPLQIHDTLGNRVTTKHAHGPDTSVPISGKPTYVGGLESEQSAVSLIRLVHP